MATSRWGEENRARARLSVILRSARPNHPWDPSKSGCLGCPQDSPFRLSMESHLYKIEEEP